MYSKFAQIRLTRRAEGKGLDRAFGPQHLDNRGGGPALLARGRQEKSPALGSLFDEQALLPGRELRSIARPSLSVNPSM